jgi:hypothetical protein
MTNITDLTNNVITLTNNDLFYVGDETSGTYTDGKITFENLKSSLTSDGYITAASTITDNAIVRGDGGAKGVQSSGVTIDDSDNIGTTGALTITATVPTINLATGATTAKIDGTIGDLRLYAHSINRQIEFWDANLNTKRAEILLSQKGAYLFEDLNGMYTGSGSPEGVLSAPIGSSYLRTDGGAGTTFYVKESGVGNTGWVGK